LVIVALAGAGYAWTGGAAQARAAAANAPEQPAAAAAEPTQADQIAAMTEQLAQRMQEHPEDPVGWKMLARSYSILGKDAEALAAYEKAMALTKGDASLLVDYADALAVKNNRTLAGEPIKLVMRALKIDPANVKGLLMAGTDAFDRKDYATAVKRWEKAVRGAPAESGLAERVAPALAQARALAGLPPVAVSAFTLTPAASGASSGATADAVGSKAVRGTVRLSPALARNAQPDDTVFVFARHAEGARMPLAIVRKQVKDLPFEFVLDDSSAMSPQHKLSGASQVVVGARISKSGNATPQPGDLTGQTSPLAPGAIGLQLEINTTVP